MRRLPFKASSLISLGVELELQIIDPMTYGTMSRAKDLIRNISESPYQKIIKPEITQSMIEINSTVHHAPDELYKEFDEIRLFFLDQANKLGIKFAGGGTHPFQKWVLQKIFPTKRFKNISHQYRYLSKQATVFGQHVHVGCENGDDALYLTHALARYIPHLIALSASSPFYQGIDTGYQSSRSNVFSVFPMSGLCPYLLTWEEFSTYFYKMKNVKIIKSMKDFYWDIRPKPEFGTVEIRVCDTPLTIKKAILIAAYIQSLAHYLLKERPIVVSPDIYYLYGFNKFQAARYGFDGEFINPLNLQPISIVDDMLETIQLIESHSIQLNNSDWIAQLKECVINKQNDATTLRQIFKKVQSLPGVVYEQCIMWEKD